MFLNFYPQIVKVKVTQPKLHGCNTKKFVDYEITIEVSFSVSLHFCYEPSLKAIRGLLGYEDNSLTSGANFFFTRV